MALHDVVEVLLQLRLAGEELRPVVGGFEAVAVEVITDVHPRAGIAVLPPGSADSGILFDDRERHPGLLEADRGEQAGLAGPDHDDTELAPRARVGTQWGIAGVAAVEAHLFEHHRHVLARHLRRDQPFHHRFDQCRVDRPRLGAAAVAVVPDDVERQGAGVGPVLLGHEALHLVEEDAGRSDRSLQDRPAYRFVVGHMHAGEQQCGNRDVLQGGLDLGV